MVGYSEYIEARKKYWIGKKVWYDADIYTVVDVDYNGMLLIDKPSRYAETTAVESYEVEEDEDE